MKYQHVRTFALAVLMMVTATLMLPGQGMQDLHQDNAELFTVNLGVMKGPSGFSVAKIALDEGVIAADARIDIQVHASPQEVIAKMVNGELDAAFLPSNVAANLYAKGAPISMAAVTGEGMLQMITTDESIEYIDDLEGVRIGVPGENSTPDQLTKIIFAAFGVDADTFLDLDYSVSSPAQLTQMYIAGKTPIVVLPEPFLSLAKAKKSNSIMLLEYQAIWGALTGVENYPMTVLVVNNDFMKSNPAVYQSFLDAVESSVAWVKENVEDASQEIEKLDLMSSEIARMSIPNLNLTFIPSVEAVDRVDMYFSVLYGFDSTSIGGSIPDEAFYAE